MENQYFNSPYPKSLPNGMAREIFMICYNAGYKFIRILDEGCKYNIQIKTDKDVDEVIVIIRKKISELLGGIPHIFSNYDGNENKNTRPWG